MSKYAILHGNYNIYHAEYDHYEEAKDDYDDMVRDEGDFDDLQLCKILETHEAPEREDNTPPSNRHYSIDYSGKEDVHKSWLKSMKKMNDMWRR